jgi:predicted patatin/cPLA2 family phospholipase
MENGIGTTTPVPVVPGFWTGGSSSEAYMLGIIDTGGGMRDVYGCGVFDYFMDNKIDIKYCLGVSAGSANVASYLARQRGRNLRFYAEYSTRKEYMGLRSLFSEGSYFNLNYIYSYLANENGEDPIDIARMKATDSAFVIAATNIQDGKTEYFTKDDIQQNDMRAVMASSCVPIVCKPISFKGKLYCDGGLATPIPYEKAFIDGCDRLIVILTRPEDEVMEPELNKKVYHTLLKSTPAVARGLDMHHSRYNQELSVLKVLRDEGRVILISPSDQCGVKNNCRDPELLTQLYHVGYADAKKKLAGVKFEHYTEENSTFSPKDREAE